MILLFKAWLDKKLFPIGVIVFTFILLWPIIILKDSEAWIYTLTKKFPENFLYPIFSFLTASLLITYIYNKINKCECKISKFNFSIPIIGIVFGACPSCVPFLIPILVTYFALPFPIILKFINFSWLLLVVSTVLEIYFIYKINGFEKMKNGS